MEPDMSTIITWIRTAVDLYAARKPAAGQRSFSWEESKHPRDEGGKFAEKGRTGGGGDKPEPKPDRTGPIDVPASFTTGPWQAEVKDRGDGKVGLHMVGSKFESPMVVMVKDAVNRFVGDLKGEIRGEETSGNPAINAVLGGRAKFLGRGNDGLAFDAGNGTVVKASSEVGFHWNNGLRSAHEGAERIRNQVAVNEKLRALGVPGLVPQSLDEHGGRAWATMPKLDTETPLTKEHIGQIVETVKAMQNAGYTVGDELQPGIGADGKAYIYDMGAARRLGEGVHRKHDLQDDEDRVNRLANKAGFPSVSVNPDLEHADQLAETWRVLDEFKKTGKALHPLTVKNQKRLLARTLSRLDADSQEFLRDEVDDLSKELDAAMMPIPTTPAKFSRLTARVNLAIDRYLMRARSESVSRYSWDESKHPRGEDGKFGRGSSRSLPSHARMIEAAKSGQGATDAAIEYVMEVRAAAIQDAIPSVAKRLAEAARAELGDDAPDDLQQGFEQALRDDPEIIGARFDLDGVYPEDHFTEDADGNVTGVDEESLAAAIDEAVSAAMNRLESRKALSKVERSLVRDHVRENRAERYSRLAARMDAAVERYAAKKSAKGQGEFRWVTIGGSPGEEGQHEGGTPVKIEKATGKIVAGPKGLADKGVTKLSDFGGKDHKESESSGLTEAAAVSRKWKKNDDGTYTAPNGTTWKKAAAGGEESPVNGKMYAGGHLMPIHGLSEKPASKNQESKGISSTPEKVNEDRPQKSRPAMSAKDIADEKERRESQKKWDEMSRGPLGRVKWLGETPNHRALSDSRINLKEWTEFADEIGPEAMGELVKNLTTLAHERIDQATADARKKSTSGFPIPSDAEQWQKDQIRERATQDANQHGMKKHVKGNPESLFGRQLLQELLDNDNNPSGKSSIENMHDLNRMLAEAKGTKPAPSGSWERKGDAVDAVDDRIAEIKEREARTPKAKRVVSPTHEQVDQLRDLLREDFPGASVKLSSTKNPSVNIYPPKGKRNFSVEEHNGLRHLLRNLGYVDSIDGLHRAPVDHATASIGNLVLDADGPHASFADEGEAPAIRKRREKIEKAREESNRVTKAAVEGSGFTKHTDAVSRRLNDEQERIENRPGSAIAKPAPAPTAKPGVAGSQSSLFGGDDIRTGQKALFNVVRPEKGGKKPVAPDLLANVSAQVKAALASKATLSPADVAGTQLQEPSLEGQKDLFSRVQDSVDRYLKSNKI